MAETGSESIEIGATPEEILEIVSNIEAYPDWLPAFQRAEILEKDSKGRPKRAAFTLDARIKIIDYTLEYEYPGNGVSWTLVEGDVKDLSGSYALDPDGDRTKVTYSYSIDPGIPMPGFLRKQAVKTMVTTALGDLKKRAEAR